jgi:hypothetical protein
MENSKVRNLKKKIKIHGTWEERDMCAVICLQFLYVRPKTKLFLLFSFSSIYIFFFLNRNRDGKCKGNIIVNKNYVKVMKNMLLTCEASVGYSIGILVV